MADQNGGGAPRLQVAAGQAPAGAVRLTELPSGAEARLAGTQLDADTRDLLRALGLTDASTLRVCKSGDPFIIEVRETRLGLSRVVASNIHVVRFDLQRAGSRIER